MHSTETQFLRAPVKCEVERFGTQLDRAVPGDQHRVRIDEELLRGEFAVLRAEAGDGTSHSRLLLILRKLETDATQVAPCELGQRGAYRPARQNGGQRAVGTRSELMHRVAVAGHLNTRVK